MQNTSGISESSEDIGVVPSGHDWESWLGNIIDATMSPTPGTLSDVGELKQVVQLIHAW